MYHKILVPYDVSSASERSVDHAVSLAKSIKASLIILHVIPQLPIPAWAKKPENFQDPDLSEVHIAEKMTGIYELLIKTAKLELDQKKKEFSSQGITIRTEVLQGHVVDEIIDYSKREGIDLIVISNTNSRLSTGSNPMGSVSRSVCERSACPVLIVR
jgi:nucleotide-binding universal stress UspA family protein